MQRRPRNVIAFALIEMSGRVEYWQQHTKNGFSRLGFALDDSAVIADNLRDQGETKSAARRLGRDERIKQVGQQILRHAVAIVLDAKLQRQGNTRFLSGHREANAWTESGRELNFAVAAEIGDCLGGVLYQVEKHLNQLVLICQHRR